MNARNEDFADGVDIIEALVVYSDADTTVAPGDY